MHGAATVRDAKSTVAFKSISCRSPLGGSCQCRCRYMTILGWTKKRSDHPMADEKGAKELLAELPVQDPFKTLQEVTHWLGAGRDPEGLKPQRLYEIIDLLDAAGRQHARKLSHEYLAA